MTKKDVTTIKDLEIYYNKIRKIRFKDDVIIKSIEDILYYTIDLKQDPIETYFVRGGLQCDYDRYRSLDDIIKLSKFYFPKSRIKDILFEIIKYEAGRTNGAGFMYNYCPDIRKHLKQNVNI